MADKPKLRVVDNPSVTERYFNKVVATVGDASGIQIILGSQRFVPAKTDSPPDGHPSVFVTGRIVLSPEAAVDLVNSLNQLMNVMSRPANPLKAN